MRQPMAKRRPSPASTLTSPANRYIFLEDLVMDQRHQCLIYQGSPAGQLPAVAATIRKKLRENERCLYLNSPPMVAGLRSYLFATALMFLWRSRKGASCCRQTVDPFKMKCSTLMECWTC